MSLAGELSRSQSLALLAHFQPTLLPPLGMQLAPGAAAVKEAQAAELLRTVRHIRSLGCSDADVARVLGSAVGAE